MRLNKEILLAFAAVLVAIKFVIVPWYQAQDEQIAGLEVSSKKLGRATALQNQQQQLETQLRELSAILAAYDELLPKGADKNAVSLAVQSQWQQIFEQQQIEVQSFNWTGERQVAQSNYWVARVALKLSGPLHKTLSALAKLEQQYPGLSFAESQLNHASGLQFAQNHDVQLTIDVLFKVDAS